MSDYPDHHSAVSKYPRYHPDEYIGMPSSSRAPPHRYSNSDGDIPAYEVDDYNYNIPDAYDSAPAPSIPDRRYVTDDRSSRRDSANASTSYQYRQDPQPTRSWHDRLPAHLNPRDSAASLQSSTGSYAIDERKAHAWEVAHDWNFMPSRGSSAEGSTQSRQSTARSNESTAFANGGDAPSPRRVMNFSRPNRGVGGGGSDAGSVAAAERRRVYQRPDTAENGDLRPTSAGARIEKNLASDMNGLKLGNGLEARVRDMDRARTASQPHSQQTLRPNGLARSGRVYTRPKLSPVPSAASGITLSQLREQREEEEAAESQEQAPHIDGREEQIPEEAEDSNEATTFMRNAVQPSVSASSSTTSFASQVEAVPPSHYPTILKQPPGRKTPRDMPTSEVFENYHTYPATRAPPPSINTQAGPRNSYYVAEDPSNRSSTSTTKTNGATNSNPASAHTSATSSSQPSMDIDRITPVVTSPPQSPMKPFYPNNLMAARSTSNSSGPRAQPVRTNSSTSSGATSAMEAFKASNYDVATLTEHQIAKLKKKGIDPALYMEMRAATGQLMGKDGKKRSKWSRALVGNTFIG